MDGYSEEVERQMSRLYDSLSERDRRRYAAVEAAKLGHGGIEYLSRVLGCDPGTIRHGISEMESPDELDTQRQRKKGWTQTADRNVSAVGRELSGSATRPHRWRSDAGRCPLDEPLSPTDFTTTENARHPRRKKRRVESAVETRIPSSQAAEKTHDGTACRPQCTVRKDRPTQTAIP